MVFVFLFIAAVLVVPIMVDIHKHGRNHILRRVGTDIADLEVSRKVLGFAHISVASIQGAVATTVTISSILVVVFGAWYLLHLVQQLLDLFVR